MGTGIIACAFGQQDTHTPGPSNMMIGAIALGIKQETGGLLSTQWEVEAYLASIMHRADHLVSEFGAENHYVTTEQVFESSLAYFQSTRSDLRDIVIVAHPLHLRAIHVAMKRWSLDPRFHFMSEYDTRMSSIPYDRSPGNTQSWTRGPLRFGVYLVRAQLFGTHGS